ncbi:DNA repair protein RecN [Planobacterium oryzisoli]|uniref:DNA repair protein RecN n=1 Tax=Planobacterium oryzisoli TaxID=2771435 RepID=A0A930YWQ3_9FLAO|nr:DNA repair protein RecN [Planobacterium oryzisoli]MBF5027827.1 DNA repair protein RecN [Planobacterium oryzisoli]
MLKKIFIQNFALIDHLNIDLQEGLQVITGETGAGKSIILGALRLLRGERADLKMMADPEKKCIVEAEFHLTDFYRDLFEKHQLDFDSTAYLRREIGTNGKSRAFINDSPVTLDLLKAVSSQLIDIHSQFQTSDLFTQEFQFAILDSVAGSRDLRDNYQILFREMESARKRKQEKLQELQSLQLQEDFQLHLFNELSQAELETTDWEDLKQKYATQQHATQIVELLSEAFQRIDMEGAGILDGMGELRVKLSKVAELSHEFTELYERFEQNFLEFKDIVFELQNKSEEIHVDPSAKQALEERIDRIHFLLQKHKASEISELIALRDSLGRGQEQILQLQEEIAALELESNKMQPALEKSAAQLSAFRSKAAEKVSARLEKILSRLGLEKAKIQMQLTPLPQLGIYGQDKIEILFQANAGFDLRPIQEAVSGGERSRVMLAIKYILAESAFLPTLILDEIDTGVSGKIAEEMGVLMREMAQQMQLVVITHLAQVAAKGDHNYKVVKLQGAERTTTTIIPLNAEEKLQEIAQLLSGATVTAAAMEQAKALISTPM